MYFDFECIIKNKKHIPIACGLYIKSDYRNILEDTYGSFSCKDQQSGGSTDIVDWFISRVNYYNKFFKDYLKLLFHLMNILLLHFLLSVSIVENLGKDIGRDHDHLNGKFRGYAHNKCNLQAS